MPHNKARGPGQIRGPIGPLRPEPGPGPLRPAPYRPIPPVPPPPRPAEPVTVLRPADLLLVRFSFANLQLVQTAGSRVLTALVPGRPASLIVDFPPQHLIEEAFPETSGGGDSLSQPRLLPEGSTPESLQPQPNSDKKPDQPPVQASLSANSRLVFKVGSETIPWSLDGLLDAMIRLPLSVAPHAENPFHVFAPISHQVISDAIRRPGAVKTLLAGQGHTLPGVYRAAGRSAAAARLFDHRLGREVSAQISAVSRFAADLGIPLRPANPGPMRAQKPPPPRAPGPGETAIELPWRLQISPPGTAGFTHATDPVEHGGRIELWHSRLGHHGEDGVDDSHGATIRAIWARDMTPPLAPAFPDAMGGTDVPFFTKSLTTYDRQMLVHETSDFHLTRDQAKRIPWTPPAVDVDRLMLTALGGWLSSDFNAPTLPFGQFSITEWKHRATMGRDHEVKVVYAGFLFPFGHPASLVKVTERKIDAHPDLPGRYAYLRQRFFIVVRQQTVRYPADTEYTWTAARTFLDASDSGAKRLDLANPFSSISILTRVTPNLEAPEQEPGVNGSFCFFPAVNGSPYAFKILAKDREDNIVEYGGPLMFVERPRNATPADVEQAAKIYCAATENKRIHALRGQRVAFAASKDADGKPLDTTLGVKTLHFDAAALYPPPDRTQDDPGFWPVLRTAEVVSPAMSTLAGASAPIVMVQPLAYLAGGFDKDQNPHHVFLGVADENNKPPMSFEQQANRSGGFVTPSLSVVGLSGSKGPVSGSTISDTMSKEIEPQTFFGNMPAKLFGVVELWKLLPKLNADNMPSFIAGSVNQVTGFLDDLDRLTKLSIDVGPHLDVAKAKAKTVIDAFSDIALLGGAKPAIEDLGNTLDDLATAINGAAAVPSALRADASGIARRLGEYAGTAQGIVESANQLLSGTTLPETVNAKLNWSTDLLPWPSLDAALFLPDGGKGKLDLHVEIQAPTTADKEPTTTVACSISPFSLRLLGDVPFITLKITAMEFTVVAGRKPDVNVVIADKDGVVFGGPLSFVNTLSTVIPFDGFSDPPYVDVDAQGITAGFDLALPDLCIGVLSLCNISLGAKALVPFIGDSLDFTFSFCSRENPFRLTVWLFGGGGFFAITITPERCRMLEASFEFGAAVALDFGVASGSIECMAGIYFKLEFNDPDGDDSELAGYFRLRGEVDVLGLISASIELYLELSYEPPSGKATGKASLSIEVEVLFLSFSVEISCEKKFKGSNGDPKFDVVMGRQSGGTRAWDDYCNAFAAS